ncbi:hypothetical protein [Endozoicomonas sp. GU-1]|uniref:hypothetical protein n=1 Tax=Endozoicomonas sp. GU-1 TaxID=3009078 RepID=UPI0022B34FFC|nr:hypothetical protein [Endozoicomonas sp. GU-1]WBA79796.1 hypothetical protein O2T12_15660 [Endozoicomonas sp. GU-1]
MTPDQVIQEFTRKPDRTKYLVAITRFKAECCQKGLLLKGRRISPDEVVNEFQVARATLELARFMEECCLKGLPLKGRQVTPEAVVRAFPDSLPGKLGIARFMEQCCLRGLPLNSQQVTPDDVVKAFPENPEGKLGKARFIAECCLKGLILNGQRVSPDAVVRHYQAARATLEIARFKAECCLQGLLLKGQQVTPAMVVKDFPDSVQGKLGIARFKAECCLRDLALLGQQVTPDEVVKDFPDSPLGKLGIARFKAECCLRGLVLYGQQVTADAVVNDYQAANATLELAHFKAECCLKGLLLKGRHVTSDEVVKGFPDNPEGRLGLAHFMERCCLKGMALNGQQITPDTVVKRFPNSPEGRLGTLRFSEQCCLKGLALPNRQATPDVVAKNYQGAGATLELARFKAECCLRGLVLNGQQVTTDAVVKGYQAAGATLELARFKEECCLRGLVLNGQQVTPDAVVKDFPDTREGRLGIARFKEQCCLRALALNHRQVTPDEVVRGFRAARAPLAQARFKMECCLRGLAVNGQQVTPDAVVKDFPESSDGKLGIVRFKDQCCLRGLAFNGQQVTPEAVVKDYERSGWLLEKAVFYSQLALNARELNSACLDNRKVLAAFNEAPGDQSAKQIRYLIQKLKQSQKYEETSEAQETLQEAWQILNSVSVKDDEHDRLECLLKFMAMQHGLSIDHQVVSAQQVLQSITGLRRSFKNSRIHFFFLAHCYITSQSINGQAIHKEQVLNCLQHFPEGSKRRHALVSWFEQRNCEVHKARIIDSLLYKRANTVASGSSPQRHAASASQHKAAVPVKYPVATADGPGFPERQASRLNVLILNTLEIIQEINDACDVPAILVTGSYARCLQNLCSSFNDIDIICTTDESARTLFEKLQVLNTDRDSEIPKSMTISRAPGCPAIKLPTAYNIQLKDGDLGMKVMDLQVSVNALVTDRNTARLAIDVPGVNRPVWCLSFAEETGLLNNTLAYLADNLELLTDRLQRREISSIPRTILFNFPQNPEEHIYGLLMRSLLTLNKARQFIALHRENKPGKPDCQTHQRQKQQQRLQVLTENLQVKLKSHIYRQAFEHRVNSWLLTAVHESDFEIKRKDFVTTLLAMIQPESRPSPG